MAYSAALGESDRRYYDTSAGVLAHPMFPVCYEWPVSLPIRQIEALGPLFPLLVHAEHDLRLYRLPRERDHVSTHARIVGVHKRKPGAFVVFRFETQDTSGELVSVSDFGALYRGVDVDGPDRGAAIELPPPAEGLKTAGAIDVGANLAHVYTECARIFNPIHTDAAVARAAGLPQIILHGTATLGLAVSRLIDARGGEPTDVRRIAGQFAAMVTMPSDVTLRFVASDELFAHFEVLDHAGRAAIRGGLIEWRSPRG